VRSSRAVPTTANGGHASASLFELQPAGWVERSEAHQQYATRHQLVRQGAQVPVAGCFTLVGWSPGSRQCGSPGGRQRWASGHRKRGNLCLSKRSFL